MARAIPTPMLAASAALVALAALASFPVASAMVTASPGPCNGGVTVEDQAFNQNECDTCRGTIVVQVGVDNRNLCSDGCQGSLIVQVGVQNDNDCGGQAMASPAAAPVGCPPQLPPDNFYCHLVGYLQGATVCGWMPMVC